MIDRRIFSLAVVICCLLAMVSLSASLESTVATSPGEAIELEYASLPLSVQEASEIKRSYHSGGSGEDREATSVSRSAERESDIERAGGASEAERSDGTSEAERSGGASDTDRSGGDSRSEPEQGFFEKLAGFLSTVVSALLWPVVVLVGLLSFSRRDSIRAWVNRHLQGHLSPVEAATTDADDGRPFHPPEDLVERSWVELLAKADIDPDPSATPREVAADLVGAGWDRRAVWELTELFEETRYGDKPVTATRAGRALRCLRQCRRQEVTAE